MHRSLILFRNHQTHTLNGGSQIRNIGHQLYGAVGGDHLTPIQEIAIQQTADQGGIADLVQNVLRSQGEGCIFIGIGKDLFHFLQALCRHNIAQAAANGTFCVPGTASQTETVHGNGGNAIVLHLELDTGQHRAALIDRNGKDRTADQILQCVLGNVNGTAAVNVRQLRVILGTFCTDSKGSVTAADRYLIILIHHDGNRTFRQAADDISKESCGQDAGTDLGNFGIDLVRNGSFHIIAGKGQAVSGSAENALQNSQTALLCNGTACNIQALHQHTFFTGKTHKHFPFCLDK